jgi:hypothetical protein
MPWLATLAVSPVAQNVSKLPPATLHQISAASVAPARIVAEPVSVRRNCRSGVLPLDVQAVVV